MTGLSAGNVLAYVLYWAGKVGSTALVAIVFVRVRAVRALVLVLLVIRGFLVSKVPGTVGSALLRRGAAGDVRSLLFVCIILVIVVRNDDDALAFGFRSALNLFILLRPHGSQGGKL